MKKIEAEIAVAFTGPHQAELIEIDAPPELQPDEIHCRTLFTLISPGTELASSYTRDDITEARFGGYAAVGVVEQKGAAVDGFDIGGTVFCPGSHRNFQQLPATDAVLVPEAVTPQIAPLARLMGVTMTTLITTTARAGDRVMVTGLGPVGYLGTQVFRRGGFEVFCCDPDVGRQGFARRSGLENVYSRVPLDDPAIAGSIHLVVECSGQEQAVLDACDIVRPRGEVVLVGVPWQRRTDIAAHTLLERVFHNYVIVRSGWEWELPVHETLRFQDHTLQKNYATALEWLADGSIYTEGLCHIVSPRDCQQAYQDCLHHATKGLFTLFDWTTLEKES